MSIILYTVYRLVLECEQVVNCNIQKVQFTSFFVGDMKIKYIQYEDKIYIKSIAYK